MPLHLHLELISILVIVSLLQCDQMRMVDLSTNMVKHERDAADRSRSFLISFICNLMCRAKPTMTSSYRTFKYCVCIQSLIFQLAGPPNSADLNTICSVCIRLYINMPSRSERWIMVAWSFQMKCGQSIIWNAQNIFLFLIEMPTCPDFVLLYFGKMILKTYRI